LTCRVIARLFGAGHLRARAQPAKPLVSERPGGAFSKGATIMRNAQAIADSYVAAWNEGDLARRRLAIAELWAPDGEHFVDVRAARGHDALEKRITGSYDKNVRDGSHRFRAVQDARALRDVVTFHWEMLRTDSDTVIGRGFEVLIVNDWGRIVTDYQFFLSRAPEAA
jgi:hypothetical protein